MISACVEDGAASFCRVEDALTTRPARVNRYPVVERLRSASPDPAKLESQYPWSSHCPRENLIVKSGASSSSVQSGVCLSACSSHGVESSCVAQPISYRVVLVRYSSEPTAP